jgi:hypothetical protein
LLEDRHVGLNHQPPLERCDGSAEIQWLDEHLNAAGGAAAVDREENPGLAESVDGLDGAVGEHLVHSDERPVDIGQQQPDRRGRVAHRMAR